MLVKVAYGINATSSARLTMLVFEIMQNNAETILLLFTLSLVKILINDD